MRGRVRTIARVGALVGLALLLSSCIKLTMDLQVQSDNTVSGTVQLGIQKELLQLSGGSIDDILGSDSPFPSDAPGVTVKDFDDGTFAGKEFTFASVPITEFQNPGAADSLSITRQGDTFVVAGVLDMSSGLSGATSPFGESGQALFDSAVIKISMTFPGAVQEASGTIDGNTVTWEPEFGERLEITATASAIDNGEAEASSGGGDGGSSNTILYIVIAAVVVIAIVAFFVIRSRRGKGGGGSGADTGFAPATPTAPEAPMVPETPAPPAGPPPSPPAPPTPPAPPAPPAG